MTRTNLNFEKIETEQAKHFYFLDCSPPKQKQNTYTSVVSNFKSHHPTRLHCNLKHKNR